MWALYAKERLQLCLTAAAAAAGGACCRVDVVSPQLPVQQGFWSVPVTSVGLTFPAGSSKAAAGACAGFTGDSSSNSPAGCIGILDSGTFQIIGSIDQVAVLNAALGGVPSIKQLPFNCGTVVGEVLSATAQALSSSDPNAAANQVSKAAVQRIAVSTIKNTQLNTLPQKHSEALQCC